MNDGVELEALGRVHRHSWIASWPPAPGCHPASSEAWVRNAASGRHDLAGVCIGHCSPPSGPAPAGDALLVDRQRDRILAEAFLRDEGLGRVDELLEVLEPVLAFLVGLVEVDKP
jgi:hypothetical protein